MTRARHATAVLWAAITALSLAGAVLTVVAWSGLAAGTRCRTWLNRAEAQFTALRCFALDGTGHATHQEQAKLIRRYIMWRNNHAHDQRLRRIVDRANVA